MIVGLKRRRRSKTYYDLGVVDYIYVWQSDHYKPRKGDKDLLAVTETMGRIKVSRPPTDIRGIMVTTFNSHKFGRRYTYFDNRYYTRNIYLLEKICEEDEPAACKREDCPHRFRCFTSSVVSHCR